MKKFTWLMSGLLLVAMSVSTAVAAPKEGKKKKAPAGAKKVRKERAAKAPGGMAEMIKVVGLDAAQQAELKAKIKAQAEARKAWAADPAKGGRVKKIKEELKAAGDDKAKVAPLKKELAELMKGARGGAVSIESVLRADQKAKWEAYKLQRQMTGKLKKAELTCDQNTKIAALCDAAAKKLAAVKADDRKGRGKVLKALQGDIQGTLTAEQKAKLTAGRKPKEPKEPKAPKKPRKKPAKKQPK